MDEQQERLELVRAVMAYWSEFKEILDAIAANALSSDPILGAAEFASLYSPDEVTTAAGAAQDVGMTPGQGVLSFVYLMAAAGAEKQRRGSLLDRLKSKLPPASGTPAHSPLAMVNLAIEVLGSAGPDQSLAGQFADLYAERLAEMMEP